MPEPAQALVPRQRRGEGLPKDNACIFNSVMSVDLQVALALHSQIKAAVPCEAVEHVVEKAYASIDC